MGKASAPELARGARVVDKHPLDDVIRSDRMPHIWCPAVALASPCAAMPGHPGLRHPVGQAHRRVGIGCSGRVAGYMNLDSYHTTHGRAIRLRLASNWLTQFDGDGFQRDGDLAAIAGTT